MKKLFIYLLTAGLVFSMIVNTNTVDAIGTEASEATITFTTPDDSVAPVNPRNPEEEYPGDAASDGNVTGQSGPLTLDYISNISFPTKDISTGEMTYNSETNEPFIQISDRRGTGGGWNVQATAESFTDLDGNPTLPGAIITFTNGAMDSSSTTPAPSDVNESIVLNTNGDSDDVVSAAAREDGAALNTAEGLGTWIMAWLNDEGENENVKLYVPESTTTAGTHTATINWTLTDGPGASTP